MPGKRVTTENYMGDVLEIHSGKGYTYRPDWEYTSSKCPIKVHCPDHGWWLTKAYSHRGMKSGCPTCAKIANQARCDEMKREKVVRDNWKKWDRDRELDKEFIEKLENKYGDSLDLSEVVYIPGGLVKVRCRKHDHTYLRKSSLLKSNKGCIYCVQENNRYDDQEKVIKRFKAIHGERYIYDRVVYTGISNKVEVVCREHGSFKITPQNHIQMGSGCAKCAYARVAQSNRKSDEDWISMFKLEHGDLYDYSLAVDIKNNEKVTVLCKAHGPFEVYPYRHSKGYGCYWCEPLKSFNAHIPATLYYVRITCPDTGKRYYKIGVTKKGVMERLSRNRPDVTVLRERRYSKGQYGLNRESAIVKKYSEDVTSDGMDFWLCGGVGEIFDRDVLGYDNEAVERLAEKRCKEYAEYLRKYEEGVSNIRTRHKQVLSAVRNHFKIN